MRSSEWKGRGPLFPVPYNKRRFIPHVKGHIKRMGKDGTFPALHTGKGVLKAISRKTGK